MDPTLEASLGPYTMATPRPLNATSKQRPSTAFVAIMFDTIKPAPCPPYPVV